MKLWPRVSAARHAPEHPRQMCKVAESMPGLLVHLLVKRQLPRFHSLVVMLRLKIPHSCSVTLLAQRLVDVTSPVRLHRPVVRLPGPAGKKTQQIGACGKMMAAHKSACYAPSATRKVTNSTCSQ